MAVEDYKLIVGIDPGGAGGIAWKLGDKKPYAVKMPRMTMPRREFIEDLSKKALQKVAYIERVGARPTDKRFMQMQIQKLRDCFTTSKNLLEMYGFEIIEVEPRVWQKTHNLISVRRDETTTEKKNRHKLYAQHLYKNDGIKVIHNIADALLILDYGVNYHDAIKEMTW